MEDEDHVSASVVARFPQPDAGGALAIQPDLDPYSDDAIHLLLLPASGDVSVYASVGDVAVGDVKAVWVPSGAVTFSGGSTASLPYSPSESGPELRTLYALNTEGDSPFISFRYDGASNVLSASQDCYAGVSYSAYKTAALRLAYRPLRRPLGLGVSLEFGMIVAFRRPRGPEVTYEVQPFQLFNGNAFYELYKITSRTVSTPAGEFERPNNFPAVPGTYTGSGFTLDTSVAMENKRVHEIGYMDEAGRGWPFVIAHPTLEPFVGDNTYTPTKTVELAAITQFPRNVQLKALEYIASRGLGPRGG